ncbi:MAG: hypothetical protein FJW64_12215 [Actinobacteria bacterium]|nr:hypothetical protein [Actinomycetota bacterium]
MVRRTPPARDVPRPRPVGVGSRRPRPAGGAAALPRVGGVAGASRAPRPPRRRGGPHPRLHRPRLVRAGVRYR